jgi:hypothetical protein
MRYYRIFFCDYIRSLKVRGKYSNYVCLEIRILASSALTEHTRKSYCFCYFGRGPFWFLFKGVLLGFPKLRRFECFRHCFVDHYLVPLAAICLCIPRNCNAHLVNAESIWRTTSQRGINFSIRGKRENDHFLKSNSCRMFDAHWVSAIWSSAYTEPTQNGFKGTWQWGGFSGVFAEIGSS